MDHMDTARNLVGHTGTPWSTRPEEGNPCAASLRLPTQRLRCGFRSRGFAATRGLPSTVGPTWADPVNQCHNPTEDPMTAAQLQRLAELNDEAAQWTTNPAWARTFAAAAHQARLQAEKQQRAERYAELRTSQAIGALEDHIAAAPTPNSPSAWSAPSP